MCLLAGVGCYVLFIRTEVVTPTPLLTLRILRNGGFIGVTLVVAVASFSFANTVTYLPPFFQHAYGMSPGASSVFVMFMTVPALIFPLIAGRLVARSMRAETVLIWSLGLMVMGGVALAATSPAGPRWMALAMLVLGSGFGLHAGLADGEALARVPQRDAGMAAGWVNTLRLGTEAISVSLFGAIFTTAVQNAHGGAAATGFSLVTIATTLIALVLGIWSGVLLHRSRKTRQSTKPISPCAVSDTLHRLFQRGSRDHDHR